jgi:hypothetical protein
MGKIAKSWEVFQKTWENVQKAGLDTRDSKTPEERKIEQGFGDADRDLKAALHAGPQDEDDRKAQAAHQAWEEARQNAIDEQEAARAAPVKSVPKKDAPKDAPKK